MFQRLTPSAFSWRRRSAGSNCQASVPAAAASAEAARLTAFDNGCAALHGEVRIAGGIDQNGGVNPDESAFGGYEDRLNGIVFRFAGDKRGVEHQLHTGFFAGFQKHIFQNMGRGDAVGGSLCAAEAVRARERGCFFRYFFQNPAEGLSAAGKACIQRGNKSHDGLSAEDTEFLDQKRLRPVPRRGNGGGTAGDTAADYDRIKSHFFFDSERCNCIHRNFLLCRFYSD